MVPIVSHGGGGHPPLSSTSNVSITSSGTIPSISISKSANPNNLPFGIGRVVYSYSVWNSGSSLALDTISLSDNLCAPVRYISGDLNSNNKIDVGEVWNYQCVALISGITTNTVVATGYGNDSYHQMVSAAASATVYTNPSVTNPVTNTIVPGLPKTGFPPQEKNINNILTLVSIVSLTTIAGILLKKKLI